MSQTKSICAQSNGDGGTKAVIFARTASAEQGYSITAQLKVCRDYAASHGIEVVQEITAVGKMERKQFGAMLQFVREHPDCRVIIVEKTDRLCRDMQDFVAVDDLVEELEADVHLIKEARIIKKRARSEDKLILGIFALFARNYMLNMQEEIQKGQLVKAEKGQYPGHAPFGYVNDRKSRTIEVDPKAGPAIARVFELCGTGAHRTPSLQEVIRDTTGNAISKSRLHKILKNRFYLGSFTWKGVDYQGVHKPLVDLTTFERVQRVLSREGSTSATTGQ